MFVVVCENPEDSPDVYGPFDSREDARDWIYNSRDVAIRKGDPECPNEHPVIEVLEPIL